MKYSQTKQKNKKKLEKSQSKIQVLPTLIVLLLFLCVYFVFAGDLELSPPVKLTEDSNTFYYNNGETTNISSYIKDGTTPIIVSYESFLNESNKFGFVFNESNINSELALTPYSFDKKIYYEIQSDKDYSQYSKYILSRDLGTTQLVKNEIGQLESKTVKRFIDFSEIFTKPNNLYFYNTTEENVTVCEVYNETTFGCLKSHIELQNITRNQDRVFDFSMYKDKLNWIIEFYNLFDLDPTIGDDTDSNWNLGTMTNMEVEGTGSGANLTSNMSSGGYLSRIFDASGTVDWTNITYSLEYPYGEELPNNQQDVNWFNMTGNVLLFHMNNDSSIGENDTYVVDLSGNGNNGIVLNGTKVNSTECKFGNCFDFDGTDDGMKVLGFTDVGNSFTASAWVYPIEAPQSDGYAIVVINGYQGVNRDYKFIIQDNGSGKFRANVADGGSGYIVGSYPYSAYTWYHLALTYNGSRLTFYANGIVNGTNDAGITTYTNSVFTIGAGFQDGTTWTDNFDGSIDEVAIWNRSLSADEIKNLYNRGASKFNVSVRSCNDASCSGESWNTTSNNASFGRVEDLTDSDNRYFQYMFNYSNSSSATVRVNNITISYDTISGADTEYPQFSSYWDNNGTLTDSGTGYFNVTMTSTNGTVILQFAGTNYTASNNTADPEVFNATVSITSGGNYPYNWTSYGNGTSNLYNISDNRNYFVNNFPVGGDCNPTANQDWEISDEQVCDGVQRNIGTGEIILNPSGFLRLINRANITGNGIKLLGSGDQTSICSGCRLIG